MPAAGALAAIASAATTAQTMTEARTNRADYMGNLCVIRALATTIIDQSSSGLRRCVAVYLPTLLPTAVPTSVLLRQCIPPHTRALPSSAWISLTLV